MAPLAIIAKQAGFIVTGCDTDEVFITDEPLVREGITSLVGFSEDHLNGVDIVIATGAHGSLTNNEMISSKARGIRFILQGEAVGLFMTGAILGKKGNIGISVCGTHGKTTTTAILATLFEKAGLSPSYVIGTSDVPSIKGAGHYGTGKYFIAEADEYVTDPTLDKTVKFLWQHPQIAIFTNIDFDHPDVYKNIDEVRDAFSKMAEDVAGRNGLLIVNGDDPQVRKLLSSYSGRVLTFGLSPINDYMLKRISTQGDKTYFWVEMHKATLGEFVLSVPGEHNCLNGLSALICALEAGVSIEKVRTILPSFTGSKRRFEYKGKLPGGALLYDDYAHHPTEIRKTLLSFKERFPKKEIVVVFQPHTFSRTKQLFADFVHSFAGAKLLILMDIFSSSREAKDDSVSSKKLFEAIRAYYRNSMYLPSTSDVVQYLSQKELSGNTILITMGAGDVYKLHDTFEKIT